MEIILKDITFQEYTSGVQLFHPSKSVGQKIRTPLIFFIAFVIIFVFFVIQTSLSFVQLWLMLLPFILVFYYYTYKILLQPYLDFKQILFYQSECKYSFGEDSLIIEYDNRQSIIKYPLQSKIANKVVAFYQNDRLHVLPRRYFSEIEWHQITKTI
ncbi:MAG: hypothetical protein K1X55_04025 [Chitinophagales bacterium]|nr:hypothetical protein [Chitinophagales bacterium]